MLKRIKRNLQNRTLRSSGLPVNARGRNIARRGALAAAIVEAFCGWMSWPDALPRAGMATRRHLVDRWLRANLGFGLARVTP